MHQINIKRINSFSDLNLFYLSKNITESLTKSDILNIFSQDDKIDFAKKIALDAKDQLFQGKMVGFFDFEPIA